ncbi:hypothetical protein I6N98_00875 [Spongiibacter nanhainus]|uniref:QsdR TetR regulatory C-terminal domain-containing protein n=1 Tax=Spongiibacter nanhainus TaxID=2794344 RepID=A0A7T4R1D3_9GAMM|nr:QsdR family transcriptional regulator [Spongiibacter nanhainus]QQD18462.1 hypothetical protein I6N98_00875 [Spongiibacter nanhainus]
MPTSATAQAVSRPQRGAEGRRQLLALAQKQWLENAQLDLGALATELGIGRATVFRWAGSRDALLGEVIWSFHEPELQAALAATTLRGPALMSHMCRCSMQSVRDFEPMRRWTEKDPEYALRILSSESNVIFQRATAFTQALLDREQGDGFLQPVMDSAELARLLVRIETSFLFSDLACGQEPSIDSACTAIRVLTEAQPKPINKQTDNNNSHSGSR